MTNNQIPAEFNAATWTPHVKCPACLSAATVTTRTVTTQPGDTARIRYHKCRICQASFKSVEAIQ